MDLLDRTVKVAGEPVKLTPTEYGLLRLFVQHAGRILTHGQILREVWGPNADEETNYLRVYITGLRKKIEANPQMPELIVTEPGASGTGFASCRLEEGRRAGYRGSMARARLLKVLHSIENAFSPVLLRPGDPDPRGGHRRTAARRLGPARVHRLRAPPRAVDHLRRRR